MTVRAACLLLILAILQVAFGAGPAVAQTVSAERLEGLWTATKWFGPPTQGRMVLRQVGDRWIAQLASRWVDVRESGGELAFKLANGEGDFRGRRMAGGSIIGLWRQPPTVSDGPMVTPVRLTRTVRGEWVGEVGPVADAMRFHLLIRRRADGTLGVILRNPERDLGAQLGADHLAVSGNDLALIGGRSERKDSLLASGRYDPEHDVLTLVLPNRGGSYDFTREGEVSAFFPGGLEQASYAYQAPPQLDDGWRTGTLEPADIDRAAIEMLVRQILGERMDVAGARQIHALLIARHGRLVLEEYFHGQDRDRLHTTRSAGKSVTSILVGASLAAGRPIRLSDPVYKVMNGGDFPAGLGARKRSMTLEHLLSMTSGLYCNDSDPKAPGAEETMLDQADEPDYYRYTLHVPMAYDPGQVAVYCSASPNLALGMLGRASGRDPIYDFEQLVAAPMQIRRYGWCLDGAGHPYGGGSFQVSARDFLKFGQLMLNGGVWNGHRVLSADYVQAATRPSHSIARIGYGYLWWRTRFPYQGREVEAFAALGAGAQAILVVPDLDLVVGIMAGQFASPGSVDIQLNLTPRYILPAVGAMRDGTRASLPSDYNTPYGRAPVPPPVVTPD